MYYGRTDTNKSDLNLKFRFNVGKHKGWKTVDSDLKFDGNIEKKFHEPAHLKWRAIYWRKDNGDKGNFSYCDISSVINTL